MGKWGYITIAIVVVALHAALLLYRPHLTQVVAKPQAKHYRITLSRVAVKKTPPPQIPQPPQFQPVTPPTPKVLPPKPKKRAVVKKKSAPKVRKQVQKRVRYKPKPPQTVSPPPVERPQIQTAPTQRVDTATIRDRYIALVREKIQASLIYPKIAKRMRMQGVVDVVFRVYADGRTAEVRILAAPKKVLANAAKRTIEALDLPPIPKALGESSLKLSVPIEFRLKG